MRFTLKKFESCLAPQAGLYVELLSMNLNFKYQSNTLPLRIKNKIITSLPKEYRELIDSCKVNNQAGLARIKGISRARVTQILNLLKLDKNIIDKLEKLGNPMDKENNI